MFVAKTFGEGGVQFIALIANMNLIGKETKGTPSVKKQTKVEDDGYSICPVCEKKVAELEPTRGGTVTEYHKVTHQLKRFHADCYQIYCNT